MLLAAWKPDTGSSTRPQRKSGTPPSRGPCPRTCHAWSHARSEAPARRYAYANPSSSARGGRRDNKVHYTAKVLSRSLLISLALTECFWRELTNYFLLSAAFSYIPYARPSLIRHPRIHGIPHLTHFPIAVGELTWLDLCSTPSLIPLAPCYTSNNLSSPGRVIVGGVTDLYPRT